MPLSVHPFASSVSAAQALASLPSTAPDITIAYAGGPADIPQAWEGLQLPQLQALLSRLTPTPVIHGDVLDFSAPHERLLARTLQLPDTPGLIPWAALAAQDTQQACAFITPCHWHITPDQVHQTDSAHTALTEEDSRQLLALIAPWFSDDGITLEYLGPDLWLARGEAFRDLRTASLERVQGRDVRAWMPDPIQGARIQRLQTELQMLLYTHVFNDVRAERRLPPINSFWVHGTGSLTAIPEAAASPQPGTGPLCINDLSQPALQGDVQRWRQAWQALDQGLIASLQQRAAQGQAVSLTLCGERHAVRWQSQPRGLMEKIKGIFAPKSLPNLGEML